MTASPVAAEGTQDSASLVATDNSLVLVSLCDFSCKQPSDESLFVWFITLRLLELRNVQQSVWTDQVLLTCVCALWLRLPDHHRGQWAGPSPGLPWWVYSAAACRQSTSRDSSAPRESAVRTRRWQTEPCPLRSWTEQPAGHLEGPCCRSVEEKHTGLENIYTTRKKTPKDSLEAALSVQINQVQSEAQRKRKQSIHPSATQIQQHETKSSQHKKPADTTKMLWRSRGQTELHRQTTVTKAHSLCGWFTKKAE